MRSGGREGPHLLPSSKDTTVPEVVAFRGIRYNTARFGKDWSRLVAPPYDVLDERDKAALLAQSDRNIVAVDLPFVPPKSAGPDEVYAKAAQTLNTWLADGTMIQDAAPAMYVYHQTYTWAGRSFTRKKFFARMRLEAFGAGKVFPHEQTFGGPKEDRLKLMQATRCQLSAVFGLYSDPSQGITKLFNVESRAADVTATMAGVQDRLWAITDAEVTAEVGSLLRDKPIYIADGHHRYGTALTYRDWLTAKGGPLPMEHPANYVLVGFCAMEDAGAIILPTHRVLTGLGSVPPQKVLEALGAGLRFEPAPADADPDALLGAKGDLLVYSAFDRKLQVATFTNRAVLEQLAPERTPPYRQLDLAYLHRYLIDELVTAKTLAGAAPTIHYIKSAKDAIADADANNGVALLTRPCTMEELRSVSNAGDLMPQKSTYFYPKLATGMVINPLE